MSWRRKTRRPSVDELIASADLPPEVADQPWNPRLESSRGTVFPLELEWLGTDLSGMRRWKARAPLHLLMFESGAKGNSSAAAMDLVADVMPPRTTIEVAWCVPPEGADDDAAIVTVERV